MITLVVVVLGLVSMRLLPVSLIPEVDIPYITVQASSADLSAREMDETVLRPLRQQLIQINGLEDIVSEAFAQLMTHYERYGSRTDAQMKGLLFRIVRNLCMDAHRRRKRESAVSSDAEFIPDEEKDSFALIVDPSPEDLLISEENIRRMKAIFRSLSPALREVLEMKLNEEMTDGEIAKELHITKHIVQQRLARARKAVRIKWEAEEHE